MGVTVLDLLVPTTLVVIVAIRNWMGRTSGRTELVAWIVTAIVTAPVAWLGIVALGEPHGTIALVLTVLAGPTVWLGAGLHILWAELSTALGSVASGDLDGSWPIAAIAWFLLFPLVLRRMRQAVRSAERRRSAA